MKKNFFDSIKKYKIIYIFVIVALILVAGTYSWLTYRSNKTALVLTVGNIDTMQVTLKPYHINATIAPALSYENEDYVSVDAVNKSNGEGTFKLLYKINSIDEELKTENFKYTIERSTDNGSTYVEYMTGDFSSVGDSQTIEILQEKLSNRTTYNYRVYLWLDGSNGQDIAGLSFDGELNAVIENVGKEQPNRPVLGEGMIPVTIANDGSVTAISFDDDAWYDYDNKIWANAVLVKTSGVKTRAQNEVAGTPIDRSDILAYYVWVPRYAYAMNGTEEPINIKFEKANDEKTVGSATGDSYYTHPAFTFGNEELDGIWVGKFKTTGTGDNPTVLDNVKSLVNQTLSVQFDTAKKFGTNTYGMTLASDAHMMKNSEWGAATYLSHSQYGINGEIRINNNSGLKTGCGASTPNASYSSTCEIAYGSGVNEYPQSSTGNISGVFDMSGGAYEYVMGNYNNALGSSGFATMPNSKYYDMYDFTSTSSCTLATCGGHALNETQGWYGDAATFVTSSSAWLTRGGYYLRGAMSGAFWFNGDDGGAANYSSRSVIVASSETQELTYTIKYDANGGSGAPGNQTKTYGTNLTLSATKPTRDGYTFLGWSTSSSATTATYAAGATYTANSAATLYAVWKINTYTITYNANNGTGAPGNQTKTHGTNLILSSTKPTRDGYTFLGWSTSSSATTATYAAGATYTANSAATLYAVWQANTYRVVFNINDGTSETVSQDFVYGMAGNAFGKNNDGTYKWGNTGQFGSWDRTGYTLVGWSENPSAKPTDSHYAIYSSVSDDWLLGITSPRNLYAIWQPKTATVIFNINYGNGGTASQDFVYGVAGNAFGKNNDGTYKWGNTGQFGSWDRAGYTLVGWSENPSAKPTDSHYAIYSGVSDDWLLAAAPTYNLYAIWIDDILPTVTLNVTQNANDIQASINPSDSGSGIKLPYYYKLSTSSTCNTSTTGFTESNNKNYTFANPSSNGTYYVCSKVLDNAGNTKYTSKSFSYVAPGSRSPYDYTGGEQVFTALADGRYKLEVWGASGGGTNGGAGGYSTGIVTLTAGQKIYINVGGVGKEPSAPTGGAGGYNGGGAGGGSYGASYPAGSGGGGATHMATASGILKNLSSNKGAVLIVAGGGGGDCNWGTNCPGGSAGGFQGTSVKSWGNANIAGATQTTGYAFGQGCTGRNASALNNCGAEGTGGGGGGYYGGYAQTANGANSNAGGAGGSGYIGNSSLSNKAMYCYNCATSGDANTNTISVTSASTTATAGQAKKGNGYAVITYIGKPAATVSSISSYKCANTTVGSSPYVVNYTGNCTYTQSTSTSWSMKFTTSGTLTLSKAIGFDMFLVGGGGGGAAGGTVDYGGTGSFGGGGGGGGSHSNLYSVTLNAGTHAITIGAGGSAGNSGGTTSVSGNYSAAGGNAGSAQNGGTSGNGGAGGSSIYGETATAGANGVYPFDDASFGTRYGAGGGGGGAYHGWVSRWGGGGGADGGGAGVAASSDGEYAVGKNATVNSGGGGGGGGGHGGGRNAVGGAGGSGIVIFRNAA